MKCHRYCKASFTLALDLLALLLCLLHLLQSLRHNRIALFRHSTQVQVRLVCSLFLIWKENAPVNVESKLMLEYLIQWHWNPCNGRVGPARLPELAGEKLIYELVIEGY